MAIPVNVPRKKAVESSQKDVERSASRAVADDAACLEAARSGRGARRRTRA